MLQGVRRFFAILIVLVSVPSALFAQAAITGDLTLWHVDDHFEHLRRHSTLQTKSFVPDAREYTASQAMTHHIRDLLPPFSHALIDL